MTNYGDTLEAQTLNCYSGPLRLISRPRVGQFTNYSICASRTDLTRMMVSMYQVVVRKRSNH